MNPWSVEMLGLIAGVKFSHPDGRYLFWCDNEWAIGRGATNVPAPGVPRASTMKEARKVGTAWLTELEAMKFCIHCDRRVNLVDGQWVDPEATGDDEIWRETCDSHDTFTAEHEVEPE